MLNSCTFAGRLVRDPSLKYAASGTPITTFTLAVDRDRASEDGQKATDFLDIVTFGKTAELAGEHLAKGRLVAVTGRLQVRAYELQDGQKRKAYEIIADRFYYLDRKPQAEESTDTETDEVPSA